ncbi:Crp/Fnr family transcriptional regulator [Nonomuraea typhae]|uniref:Crp/Fnr family transcriptional regulator n=1 Tax=Nonomuraea typhae TaxID=2603600 RepID=UPI0012FACFB3|nr:Crp/Fnr family transcriptional regulator [Nonomuraea typhae]
MPPDLWPQDSFLGALDEPTRNALLRLGRVKTYQPGETVVHQGDAGAVVFLLLTGRVNVSTTVENGSETLLAIRHPGDILGEMAVFGNMPRTATVTVRVPATTLVVSGEVFKRFAGTHPGAAVTLAANIAERLRQANMFRADAAGYEVDQRLARAVLYQVQRFATTIDGHWAADLRQAELAMLIGAKEGTVQKAIAHMKELMISRRGRVVILDVAGLARLADMSPPGHLLGDPSSG